MLRAALVLLLVLAAPAHAAFTARTTVTSTFRAAETFGPRNVTAPSIVGAPVVGQTLTADPGVWRPSGTSLTFRWELDGRVVGTGDRYTAQTPGELRVVVSAGDVSAASTPVTVTAPVKPVNGAPPSIVGAVTFGSALTGADGAWLNSATSYTREWLRCTTSGCTLVGSTSSYTPSLNDIGFPLRYRVTARNAAGSTVAMSAETAKLAPTPKSPARLNGIAFTTASLWVDPVGWNAHPALPKQERREWWRCPGPAFVADQCSQIPGAINTTYTASTADVGQYVHVREFVAQNGAEGATAAGPIGPIAALPPRLSATLTTNVTDPTGKLSYFADGDLSTVWNPGVTRAGDWVRLDFGAVRRLSAYEATFQGGFVFEVSADGANWTQVPSDVHWASAGPSTAFEPPVHARYMRVRSFSGGNGWWFNDLRVWGS
jgi:F5/8 type C domain